MPLNKKFIWHLLDSKLYPLQGPLPISEYNVKCTEQAVIYNGCSCDWPAFSLDNTNIQPSVPFPSFGTRGWGEREGPGHDLQGLLTSILRRTTVGTFNNRHLVCQTSNTTHTQASKTWSSDRSGRGLSENPPITPRKNMVT